MNPLGRYPTGRRRRRLVPQTALTENGYEVARGISLHVGLNAIDPGHYGTEGTLAGAENDARAMERIARSLGYRSSILLTTDARAEAIRERIRQAAAELDSGDTFLFTFAGHGAQLPDAGADESDGSDETWCAYDRMLVDDEFYELWDAFRSGVAVVVVADSCHSGTSARLVMATPIATRRLPQRLATLAYDAHPQVYLSLRDISTGIERSSRASTLITLSACLDHQVAADGPGNGLFTEKLLEVWDDGAFRGDYVALVAEVRRRMPSPADQTPGYDLAGSSAEPLSRPAFALSTPTAFPAPAVACPQAGTPQATNGNAHEKGKAMQTFIENGNWEEVAAQLSQQLPTQRGNGDFMSKVIQANSHAAEEMHSGGVVNPLGGATRGGTVFRAFWWGFHVEVSHQDLDTALNAADPNGEFVRTLRVVIPQNYRYWIDIIAPFVVAGSTLMRTLDRGRGVYISMSWFAPGVFVPTSV